MAQPLTKAEVAEVNARLAPRNVTGIIGSRPECVQPELHTARDIDLARRRALTARQRAILTWIEEYIRREGAPPSLREIGKAFGIRSTNGVNDHLRALERKGYIRRRDMLSRSIVVVDGSSPSDAGMTQLREENLAPRAILRRLAFAVRQHPPLPAKLAVLLGDVSDVLGGYGS